MSAAPSLTNGALVDDACVDDACVDDACVDDACVDDACVDDAWFGFYAHSQLGAQFRLLEPLKVSLCTSPDTDEDELPNLTELILGTETADPDSGEDGLTDGFEVGPDRVFDPVVDPDPLKPDSYGDVVPDGEDNALNMRTLIKMGSTVTGWETPVIETSLKDVKPGPYELQGSFTATTAPQTPEGF